MENRSTAQFLSQPPWAAAVSDVRRLSQEATLADLERLLEKVRHILLRLRLLFVPLAKWHNQKIARRPSRCVKHAICPMEGQGRVDKEAERGSKK
jgi:hypothetical protein